MRFDHDLARKSTCVTASRVIAYHLDDWGPKRRTRMALLASPDVGVRGRAFLEAEHSSLLPSAGSGGPETH